MPRKSKSMRAKIIQLDVGKSIAFPVEKTGYIRCASSTLSTELNRQYSCTVNREKRTITVTRNS